MSIISVLNKASINLRYKKRYIGEYVNILKKRNLIKKVTLTPQQKRSIDELWTKNYGKRIPYYWHKLYTSYTGVFDVNYFPEIYYSTILERYYDDENVAKALEDKAQLDTFLYSENGERVTVETIVSNTAGRFFDGHHNIIDLDQAVDLLRDKDKVVIKPSRDTDSGRGIEVLEIRGDINIRTNEKLQDILLRYKADFVTQSFIKTHKSIRDLYPDSVNTIRIVTFICDDNAISHFPLAMRIGANGANVDNIHAGGMVIGMDDYGILKQYAFSEYGEKFEKHPQTGILFNGYKISSVDKAIEMVTKLHARIPRLTFISWDVTILENGDPVVLEMNTRNQSIWFPQMVNGESAFGPHTIQMIRMCKRR